MPDDDELEEILDDEIIDDRREGSRPCPVCSRVMAVEIKKGVSVDVCAEHGIWLDSGEIEKILLAKSRGTFRDRQRKRRMLDAAKREGRREGAAFGWWSVLF